jgi:hypothetical protein
VAPPLVISDQQLELAMDGIEAVFQLLDRNPLQTIIRALGVLDEPASSIAAAHDHKPAGAPLRATANPLVAPHAKKIP